MHVRTHTRYIFQYLFSEVVTGASQESCWIVVSCSERVGALGDGSHTQDGDHVDHTVCCVLVEYCKLLQQILFSLSPYSPKLWIYNYQNEICYGYRVLDV